MSMEVPAGNSWQACPWMLDRVDGCGGSFPGAPPSHMSCIGSAGHFFGSFSHTVVMGTSSRPGRGGISLFFSGKVSKNSPGFWAPQLPWSCTLRVALLCSGACALEFLLPPGSGEARGWGSRRAQGCGEQWVPPPVPRGRPGLSPLCVQPSPGSQAALTYLSVRGLTLFRDRSAPFCCFPCQCRGAAASWGSATEETFLS